MSKARSQQDYWETSDRAILYLNLIGFEYGDEPWTREEDIARDKRVTAEIILSDLNLPSKSAAGAEIGLGFGYQTRIYGERSRRFYACDISRTYLDRARSHCAGVDGMSFHHIEPGDLSCLPVGELDFMISHNVFIHLTFYEMVRYLKQIHKRLKSGGKFWFDILNLDTLNIATSEPFHNMEKLLTEDPGHRCSLQFNSLNAVRGACEKIGFSFSDLRRHGDAAQLMIEKY